MSPEENRPLDESSGYKYLAPDGKSVVNPADYPGFPEEALPDELQWHLDHKTYRHVWRAEGGSWTRELALSAIAIGHADGFEIVPNPDYPQDEQQYCFNPFILDKRELGDRVANRFLKGFNQPTRV